VELEEEEGEWNWRSRRGAELGGVGELGGGGGVELEGLPDTNPRTKH